MEEKRLDLDAPLVSFKPQKVHIFSQLEIPLAIPFNWEKTPGQPKDNFFSTITIENEANWLKNASLIHESEASVGTTCHGEAFSDAPEDFSMNCSMSGGGKDCFGRIGIDPHVKDFMMGRFLPHALAIADDLPKRAWRKPPGVQVNECSLQCEKSDLQIRRRLRLDYQYQQEEEEEEYDDEYGCYAGSSFLSSKACGLIKRFCLNPVPCLKSQGRQLNVWQHVSLGEAQDEDSWEEVYKYKLNRGYYPRKSDGSKLMSESNQFTSCSDSQMLDGSSFLNSTIGTLSPDKHEDSNRESDLCEKVYGSSWETTCLHDRLQCSCSTSSSKERPLNQNSLTLQETLDYKLEESIVIENSKGYALQSKSSKFVECGFSTYFENDSNNVNNDLGLTLKVDLLEKNDRSLALSLCPLPLPTSPSESWLRRTLPYVSSKVQHQTSFLGIQLQSRKHVTYEKSSNIHPRRRRFVEVARVHDGALKHDDVEI